MFSLTYGLCRQKPPLKESGEAAVRAGWPRRKKTNGGVPGEKGKLKEKNNRNLPPGDLLSTAALEGCLNLGFIFNVGGDASWVVIPGVGAVEERMKLIQPPL